MYKNYCSSGYEFKEEMKRKLAPVRKGATRKEILRALLINTPRYKEEGGQYVGSDHENAHL